MVYRCVAYGCRMGFARPRHVGNGPYEKEGQQDGDNGGGCCLWSVGKPQRRGRGKCSDYTHDKRLRIIISGTMGAGERVLSHNGFDTVLLGCVPHLGDYTGRSIGPLV